MCAGNGKRWNNYLGIPKHLVKINGETLIGRTTRLLKEKNINDYIITCNNNIYAEYGKTIEQTFNDCEIDRFEESVANDEICYLYGDVYYSKNAIDTIINTQTKDILFFGSKYEIFAVKIKDLGLFFEHKRKVKKLFLNNQIDRCIGWEIYRSLNNIPFNEHKITDRYIKIIDETDDIDFPEDYEKFMQRGQK